MRCCADVTAGLACLSAPRVNRWYVERFEVADVSGRQGQGPNLRRGRNERVQRRNGAALRGGAASAAPRRFGNDLINWQNPACKPCFQRPKPRRQTFDPNPFAKARYAVGQFVKGNDAQPEVPLTRKKFEHARVRNRLDQFRNNVGVEEKRSHAQKLPSTSENGLPRS